MEYRIHNDACIEDKQERKKSEELIRQHIEKVKRFVDNYPKQMVVDFYFNKINKTDYSISVVIKLKENIILIKEKGNDIEASIHKLIDRLKVALSRKIHKERKEYLYRRKSIQLMALNDSLNEIISIKENETRDLFNQLLKMLLNDIAKYMKRRIKSAEMTSAIKRGKFKLQELLDELYLIIYERIYDIPRDGLKSNIWLYQQADELLERKFNELRFEKENFERLESLVEAEYESLEESFTVDAEEEIIPMEEQDGYEQIADTYVAHDLFVGEDENSLLDEITLKVNQAQIHGIIEMELSKLPLLKRTIMDLYLINQMTIDEISSIKNISGAEVESVLDEVCSDLKLKLISML
jgi:ribosome-associated translation inhibitor RaiA/DNA-directed RNA polymerase specialized sigma24 family protein